MAYSEYFYYVINPDVIHACQEIMWHKQDQNQIIPDSNPCQTQTHPTQHIVLRAYREAYTETLFTKYGNHVRVTQTDLIFTVSYTSYIIDLVYRLSSCYIHNRSHVQAQLTKRSRTVYIIAVIHNWSHVQAQPIKHIRTWLRYIIDLT